MSSLQQKNFVQKYCPPLLLLALIQVIPFMGVYDQPSVTLYTSLFGCYAFTVAAYGSSATKVFSAVYYVALAFLSFLSTAYGLRSLTYLSGEETIAMAAFAPVIGQAMLHACRIHEFMTVTSDTVRKGMGLGDDQLNVATCLKIGYAENNRLAFTLSAASLLLLLAAPELGMMISLMIACCILVLVATMCGFISADIRQMLRIQWVYSTPHTWAAITAWVIQIIVVILTIMESMVGNPNAILAFPSAIAIAATGLIVLHTSTVRK